MVKLTMKRIASPRTWRIDRKESVFISRPNPGAHPMGFCVSLSHAMRELLKVAKTAKEARRIIKSKDVFVDKRKRVEEKHPVGLMDIIEFPQLERQFRILLDSKGRLTSVEVDNKESSSKISRILSKSLLKTGKVQLNLGDGRSLLVDKDIYKTGDSLELSLPDQKIKSHLKFEKGASILLIGGRHAGSLGKIDDVLEHKIIVKASNNEKFETLKKYAFVIGKDKPLYDCFKKAKRK